MQLQVDGPVHLSDWHAEATCSEGIIGGMKRHMAKRSESDVFNVLWTAIGTVTGVRCGRLQRRARLGDD